MEPDQQQQEKGLFTFYRQQADLQNQLKAKRRLLRQAKVEKIENKQRRLHNNSNPNQQVQHLNKQYLGKKLGQSRTKLESTDKLIGLLSKFNGKQIKKRQNLKIILESQQQIPSQNTLNLKSRLQRLLDDQQKSQQFKLVANQQKLDFQCFTNRKELTSRLNPLQKRAIIPTYFKSQPESQLNRQIPKKKSLLRQRSFANSIQLKKIDKIEANHNINYRYQLRYIKDLSDPKRVNLPRIEARANSQVINKRNKTKLGQKSIVEQIQTERLKKKPQLSLLLENMRLPTECSSSRIDQNKIYSLFIQNKQVNIKEAIKAKHKEIVLSDVLKKLKFS